MTESHNQTIDLLSRWHDGDRAALLELVERNRDWIEARVRASRGPVLQRQAETIDDLQDLMVEVLEYAPRFVAANRQQFRSLLSRMIRNLLTDKARGLARRRAIGAESFGCESRLSLDPAISRPTQPGEAAARNEELAWMHLGLEFLSAEERDLIRRRQFEEQTFIEIAADLGAEPNAVRMRFQRTLLRLAGIVQSLQSGGVAALLDGAEEA